MSISSISPWRRSPASISTTSKRCAARIWKLAADYLVMAAMLIEIKSRMLLPRPKASGDDPTADPRAELVRRLMEYEQMKMARARSSMSFPRPSGNSSGSRPELKIALVRYPEVCLDDLQAAWQAVLRQATLRQKSPDRPGGIAGSRAHGHHPAATRAGGRFCPL